MGSRAVAPGNAEGSWGHSGSLWDLKGEVGGATPGSQMPEPGVRRWYLSCRALALLAIPVLQVVLILRTSGLFCVKLPFTQQVVLHGKCPSINFTGMGKHCSSMKQKGPGLGQREKRCVCEL